MKSPLLLVLPSVVYVFVHYVLFILTEGAFFIPFHCFPPLKIESYESFSERLLHCKLVSELTPLPLPVHCYRSSRKVLLTRRGRSRDSVPRRTNPWSFLSSPSSPHSSCVKAPLLQSPVPFRSRGSRNKQ